MWNHEGIVIGIGIMVGVATLWGCDADRPAQTSNKSLENLASVSRPIQLNEPLAVLPTTVGNTALTGSQSSNLSGDRKPWSVMRIDDGRQRRIDGQNINDDVELGGIMSNDGHQHAARSDSALRQYDDETRDEEVDEWSAEAPHENEDFEVPYTCEPQFEFCQDQGDTPERSDDQNVCGSCLIDFAGCLEAFMAMVESEAIVVEECDLPLETDIDGADPQFQDRPSMAEHFDPGDDACINQNQLVSEELHHFTNYTPMDTWNESCSNLLEGCSERCAHDSGVEDHCEELENQETRNCLHEFAACVVGEYPESSMLACEEAWLACIGIDVESDYGDVFGDQGEQTLEPYEVPLMNCIDVDESIYLDHREEYGCSANGNWDDELDGTRHGGQSCNNDPLDSCDEDLTHCIDAVVPRAGGDTPERPNLEASCRQQFGACLEAALAMFSDASNQHENSDIEGEYVACDSRLDTCLDGCLSDQMETHCHEAHEQCIDTITASENRDVDEENPSGDGLGHCSDVGETCLDD